MENAKVARNALGRNKTGIIGYWKLNGGERRMLD